MKTIEEMKKELRDYCESERVFDCGVCPLRVISGPCFPDNDELLKKNYGLVFGDIKDVDNVNHPKHYQGRFECIDEMVALFGVDVVKHFCACNVYKYRYRATSKNGKEDIEKAEWYMNKLMELGGVDGWERIIL